MILAEIGHNYEGRYVPVPSGETNDDFIRRHWRREGFCTPMGRTAIDLVLRQLSLQADDEVYVTTTYGADYVSSIVTCAIFNYCRPSKVLTERTKLIYLIHEFGVPHPETRALSRLANERNVPLLEDCAYCVDSRHADGRRVGEDGSYVIYSLPKVFEVPSGGILIGPVPRASYVPRRGERAMLAEIEHCLSGCYARAASIGAKRRENWAYLTKGISRLGFKPFLVLPDGVAPYCFPFHAPGARDEIIRAVRSSGYEAFAWRGGEVVVLPVHQELSGVDLDRMLLAAGEAREYETG